MFATYAEQFDVAYGANGDSCEVYSYNTEIIYHDTMVSASRWLRHWGSFGGFAYLATVCPMTGTLSHWTPEWEL